MKKPTALITGASGFVGFYLADELRKQGWRSFGIDISRSGDSGEFPLDICDIRDYESLESIIRSQEPDAIFHLASLSHIPRSWENPKLACEVNLMGVINLMECMRYSRGRTKVLLVGSSSEYGDSLNSNIPVTEDAPLRPQNPYATSKAAQDFIAGQYCSEHGVEVIRVRPFMHTGPRQADIFLIPFLCRQVAEVSIGTKKKITSPSLDFNFDITDVRDIAKAYCSALQDGEVGEVYNIASGNVLSIREIISKLKVLAGVDFDVEESPCMGISDLCSSSIGNSSVFTEKTGWSATIPFDKTLLDTYEFWLNEIKTKPIKRG